MTDACHVFLSYSRNDLEAAVTLRKQLNDQGLSVFRDAEEIRQGDLWLDRLQQAVEACGSFVVLIGRDGVARWIGAETQAALNRHFGPDDEAGRLPIFPILLGDTSADKLPAFLRLFQATPWNGRDPLPAALVDQIRHRTLVANEALAFEGCPFVGLDAYRFDQAQMFFGRQQETLAALACFDTRAGHTSVRWLEINGNSGSGKSSLMNAGLLPLVDQGLLWPRTGYSHWRRIGPMMPGEHPIAVLAEHLARSFGEEMADIRACLEQDDARALAEWLRSRKQSEAAFLLAVDQFEELFTFADRQECARFDRLMATALADPDCPLFVISTVRADFLDRFESNLPRLTALRNRVGKAWTLPPIGADGLREVIVGPSRLAGLDVSAVQEAMVGEARDEPGALPLVENALYWLWQQREGSSLCGQLFTAQGGLAGILSSTADDLLKSLGKQRAQALELLFQLVKVDPDGRRHTRRRIPLTEAAELAGGGERGHELVSRLAGQRARDGSKGQGPLRLITVTEESAAGNRGQPKARWVNLIHETLIRSKGLTAEGKAQPYWPTLWYYIEQHQEQAARHERLRLQAREWKDREGVAKLFGLAGWRDAYRASRIGAAGSIERQYLRWSRVNAAAWMLIIVAAVGVTVESLVWASKRELPASAIVDRWGYMLGKQLPLPELLEIPPSGSQGPTGSVSPFYLGATEVTFEQFDAFVFTTDREIKRPAGPSDPGNKPAVNVTWDEAKAYAEWLGERNSKFKDCRLPSAAEWEYACRARTMKKEFGLPKPDGSDNIERQGLANCYDCGKEDSEGTTPVGTFGPNEWGLRDMHGNVWEWSGDCAKYKGRDCKAHPLRGGSWLDSSTNTTCKAQTADPPDFRSYNVGFRVLCLPRR